MVTLCAHRLLKEVLAGCLVDWLPQCALLLPLGCLYLVDTLAGDPEVLQVDAETYYEKLLKKSSSTRDVFLIPGEEEVQTFGERIVLFVLNYIIFGMLEGSSANDAFFLPHSATECAKILWRDGEAVAFYSVKMKGSLCDGTTSQCYLLPVLDTIFVRRKYRRGGLGMKMLHDFCQSFMAEDALGISCPISAAMYQVCQKFLQSYPEEQKRLWEVEAPGDWSQRVNIWLKIQMESSPSGKAEVGSQMEYAQTSGPRQTDTNQMNKGVEYIPGVGKVAGDSTEKKDDRAAAGTLNTQGSEQEDLEQGAGNTQQCKGFRKRAGPGASVGDKATKQFRIIP
ncbi:protein FAM169B-like isoform X4 [Rissa tridactyla]|uniref:protein FAM169B-like isoform X4 n=1 Tax=Rissa tridactyla TaxID=75485 RepID=UPI0023BAB129|nr:protein FAM169B-like isoform X4 [Rissa tridactyla]